MTFLKGLKRQETGPTPGEIRTVLTAIQRERSSLEIARRPRRGGCRRAAGGPVG